jgi:hypothetical protein
MTARRYAASNEFSFIWCPPHPNARATSASLSIYYAAATQTVALTQRAMDEIVSISSDRKSITLADTATDFALPGILPVPALISYGPSSQVPVRVMRMVSQGNDSFIVELSEPLPHTIASGGVVAWQVWSVTRTAPATIQGPVRYAVSWEGVVDGLTAPDPIVDEGLLYIVRAPFSTGLTSARLVASSPWLAQHIPPGQSSWAPQIEIAQDTLIQRVIAILPEGRTIQDVTGGQFRNAHAMETRLLVMRGLQEAGANRRDQIEQLERDITAEFDRIGKAGVEWVDTDGDGTVDAGESNVTPGRVSLRAFTTRSSIINVSDSDAVTRTPTQRFRTDEWRER